MVLPRSTSPFSCMGSRLAKHLAYSFGTMTCPQSLYDLL